MNVTDFSQGITVIQFSILNLLSDSSTSAAAAP